jgi:predicted NBD/HSP70 family sugar kinase
VLFEIIVHGSLPRVELARRFGLSRASLTRIARGLVDDGLLAEGASQVTNSRGRPAESLELRADAAHVLGVKLTGDTLYAVVTDLSARVVAERTVALVSTEVPDVVAQIAAIGAEMLYGLALPAAVGVCLAGDVDRRAARSLVRRSPYLGWDGVPLAELVQGRLRLPTTVANDVHALAAVHHWFGVGVGHSSMAVYGVGAGVGVAIVVKDEVDVGVRGRPGAVGHARIAGSPIGNGMRCDRGHDDCAHSYLPIPAIEHNLGLPAGGYPEALDRLEAGDPLAAAVFRVAAYAMGTAVAESVNVLDPEVVIVTGEGMDAVRLFPADLRAGLADRLDIIPVGDVRIELPEFDFGYYARGAAVVGLRALLAD